LAALAALAEQYHSWLMIDEAHATGVVGPCGAGLAAADGVGARIDVHLGTLGKALGSAGAYVAGSRALVDWLVNRARSFIYTTGLAPAAVAAAAAALDVVAAEPERREVLARNAARVRDGLRALGFDAGGDTHIIPVLVGDNRATLRLAEALRARGVLAQAIRPLPPRPRSPASRARPRTHGAARPRRPLDPPRARQPTLDRARARPRARGARRARPGLLLRRRCDGGRGRPPHRPPVPAAARGD